MKIDLGESQGGVADYVTVPSGSYLCKVVEVRPGVTRNGDARWGLRLVVAEGEYTGRLAAWDGLTFSTRGQHRVQRIFAALGLPAEGEVDVEPEDLAGRSAFVKIEPHEYRDPATGGTVRRNGVPYDGYRRIPDDDYDATGPTQSGQAPGADSSGSSAPAGGTPAGGTPAGGTPAGGTPTLAGNPTQSQEPIDPDEIPF